MHIHFMGIGGTGASAAARLARHRGHRVSGCDQVLGRAAGQLRDEGFEILDGHDPGHLDGVDRLAFSPALLYMDVTPTEFTAARESGIAVSWHAVMAELTESLTGLAVAGTHGKSTITAMVSACLIEAGLDPTCFVGAEVAEWRGNLRPGAGELFVFEADEFNSSFLNYRPARAVLNVVEFDHPEYFSDPAAMESEYVRFLRGMRAPAEVIFQASDPGATRVVAAAGVSGVGFALAGEAFSSPDPEWLGTRLQLTEAGIRMTAQHRGETWIQLESPLAGRHNARNLLAACALAAAAGADPDACRRALGSFRGVGRRFEILGEAGPAIVIDDYAHHPSEVTATILSARQQFPGRRVVAIYQPHTHARTRALFDITAACLGEADLALVTEVFAARDAPDVRVDPAELAAAVPGRRGVAAGNLDEAAARAAEEAGRGPCVLLFMGAGDITRASRRALQLLSRQ